MLVLEGTHLLEECLKTDHVPKEIIATSAWVNSNHEILQSVPNQTVIQEVTPDVLKAALTTVNPDGVATIISHNALPKCSQEPNFVLALDRLQDPGNLGTLLRTALAADIEEIWLAAGADPLSPKTLRASSGAFFHMPCMRLGPSESESIDSLAELLQSATKRGLQVVASLVPGSLGIQPICPYWQLDWTRPTVLLLGNEGSGLHPYLLSFCTHGVTLPHNSAVESLNVAAAAVPLLMERRRAKMTF